MGVVVDMCEYANEEWRPIEGYDGYFVSDRGRIRSSDSQIPNRNGTTRIRRGRILKPSKRKNGELYYNFIKDGKQFPIAVDRLVASVFIPNEESRRYLMHKNGIVDDNDASNLVWITADEAIAIESRHQDDNNLPGETWKAVDGWVGFYEISDMGRLRSVAREINSKWGTPCIRSGKLFDLKPDKNGRQHVNLYRDGEPTLAYIDKLVADAFIPSEDGRDFIRHLNGDLNDCRLENLERVSSANQYVSNVSQPDIDDSDVEEWRPVKGFESTYEVSSLGRLRSLPRHIDAADGRSYDMKGRMISLSPSKANGYVYVNLHQDGKRTRAMVHVLVAEAFLGERLDGMVADHINRLRNDNRASNLRWVTASENCTNKSYRSKAPKTTAYTKDCNIESLPNEHWKAIDGYEDYVVSSLGRVFSLKSHKLLTQGKHTGGYHKVCLCKDGKPVNKYVHRLVAEAFIPRVEGWDQVNHISEDKEDNSVQNLEWCNQAYNNVFGTGPERRASKWDPSKAYQVRQKPVLQYDLDGNLINRWDSQAEACRELGLDANTVSRACNRRDVGQCVHGIAYGYRWDFEGVAYDA